MGRFLGELIGGIVLLVLGIGLSAASGHVLFIGLLVFGVVFIVIAFRNLAKSRKSQVGGVKIKPMHPADRPAERERFLQTLDEQKDLAEPKEVTVTCSRKDQLCQVSLNGEAVGTLTPDTPVKLTVTKENNVVDISNEYEGICFFHVAEPEGTGRLQVGMGVHTNSLKVVPGGGIGEGIAIGRVTEPGAESGAIGEDGRPVKKKMKKGAKIALIVVIAVAAVFGGALIYTQAEKAAWERTSDAYYQALYNCDVDAAMENAKKMKSDLSMDRARELEKFIALHDEGKWQEAIDQWNNEVSNASSGTLTEGKAVHMYQDCLYEVNYKPQIDAALAKKDYKKVVPILVDFSNELVTGEKQSEFGKGFPENAKHYFDATEETGKALFKAKDDEMLKTFLVDIHWQEPDETFGSYSWAEQASEWWSDHMI